MAFPRPRSPRELPNGRLVCADHDLVVCPMCCVDYSFMDEILNEDEGSDIEEDAELNDDDLGGSNTTPEPHRSTGNFGDSISYLSGPRVGTGRLIPERFHPPSQNDTATSLFPPDITKNSIPPVCRFIRRTDPTEVLFYTDGACAGNGQANPRGGCAFILNPQDSQFSFRLENKGPTGEAYKHTSNRAELRAVIAVLRFRQWKGEGFNSVVIATDSEYTVKNGTCNIQKWVRNGWKRYDGKPVQNQDLWRALLGEAERWAEQGVTIKLWLIPRDLNMTADIRAKEAADAGEVCEDYKDIMGLAI